MIPADRIDAASEAAHKLNKYVSSLRGWLTFAGSEKTIVAEHVADIERRARREFGKLAEIFEDEFGKG